MGLPDYFVQEAGTPNIVGQPGAAGVTEDITLDALASGSARMSEYVDLGQYPPDYLDVDAQIESGTAPTAGQAIDIYVVFSDSTSVWPAGVSGADGAWPADGNEDEWSKQISASYVCSVIATGDANTVQIQDRRRIPVLGRYCVVVVDNNWDQAIRNETTDTDNTSRVTLTKRWAKLADTSAGT